MGMTRMLIPRMYSRGCRRSEQVKLTGYCRISGRLPDLRKVCSPFAYDWSFFLHLKKSTAKKNKTESYPVFALIWL